MEINIDNVGPSQYYDEAMGIQSNYKKLIKNPRMKIRPLSFKALLLTGISVIFLIIFAALKIIDPAYPYYKYVIFIFAIATVFGLVYYLMIKKTISRFRNNSSSSKFIMEKDFVELQSGGETSRIEFSNIQHVIINRYSICFIPMDQTSNIIVIRSEYKSQIVNFGGYESLIVDNSSLYQ